MLGLEGLVSRVLGGVIVSVLDSLKLDHESIFEAVLERTRSDSPRDGNQGQEEEEEDLGRLTLSPSEELSLPPVADLM